MNMEKSFGISSEESQERYNGRENKTQVTPITSMEDFMEMRLINKVHIDEELHQKAVYENKRKVISTISNRISLNRIRNLVDQKIASDAGYYSNDAHLSLENLKKEFGHDCTFEAVPIHDEKNEISGHHYLAIKNSVDQTEEAVKNEINAAYLAASESKGILANGERNRQLELLVQSGEMVYLGEKMIDEYAEMIRSGMPVTGIEEIFLFNWNSEGEDLPQKIYAKIK
jgi:hypothetical protein